MSNSYEEVQKIPHAGSVMTPFPYSVDSDEEVAEVERLMREHHIRHIPVQQDGRVVGIVSERDLFHLGDRRTTLASVVAPQGPSTLLLSTA